MEVNVIHSGSSGNLTVIDGVIAIDAGWKYENVSNLKAVFLTHMHSDHTKHLSDFGGVPVYATEATAEQLMAKKFPYLAFGTVEGNKTYNIDVGHVTYMITPVLVKHDAPCVGYEIFKTGESYVIFYATDFNSIVEEERFVMQLRNKYFDELYIECNNTLSPTNFIDVYFSENDAPKDEFHRRKSYENHCNVNYLISLFERAGYSEGKPFTEPVTLLHKSSYYYMCNPEALVNLKKIANVQNLMFETENLKKK